MAHEDLIGELLLRWEDLRQQGRDASAEELCRAHPELAEDVARRIRALDAVYRVPNRLGPDEPTGPGPDGPTDLGAPPLRVGPYEVLSTLGHGGMGVVYRARQVNLDRTVALKMIVAGPHARPRDQTRFRIEAEAVARLQHPNIVSIFEVGAHEGRPYYSMELLDGGSLEQRLDGRPWPAEAAAQLVEILARAIHHAHRRGIVHRDLKPANILLTADGIPKISDFGLAKRHEDREDDSTPLVRTETGAILGTPRYMAPEQAAGQVRSLGPATDIYALGVILYELLSGRPPFRGGTPLEMLEQVRFLDPVPLRSLRPTLARDLEVICLKCLQKDPTRRYRSAEALADDLQSYLRGGPITARGSNVLHHLAMALDRSQHDREFRTWGNVVLRVAPILALPHFLMFLLVRFAPQHVEKALVFPWIVMILTIIVLFRLQWTHLRLPSSPAVRQLGTMLIGHWAAATLSYIVLRQMIPSDGVREILMPYPLVTVLAGQLFFNLGSTYWGRCYLAGLAFFATAALMPWDLTLAPLEFSVVGFTTLLAIGLHLRRLGRDATAEPPIEASSEAAPTPE